MTTPQEPWEKDFDHLWQKKLNDKGYQFTYLNRPVVGNPLGGHPKAHIKSFIRNLLSKSLAEQNEADIGWSEAVEKALVKQREEVKEKRFKVAGDLVREIVVSPSQLRIYHNEGITYSFRADQLRDLIHEGILQAIDKETKEINT